MPADGTWPPPAQPPVPPQTRLSPGSFRTTILVDSRGYALIDPRGPNRTHIGFDNNFVYGMPAIRWLHALPTAGGQLAQPSIVVDSRGFWLADPSDNQIGQPGTRVGRLLKARPSLATRRF